MVEWVPRTSGNYRRRIVIHTNLLLDINKRPYCSHSSRFKYKLLVPFQSQITNKNKNLFHIIVVTSR